MLVRHLDDPELISGARAGDSDAYGELYRRHFDAAYAAARTLTRNRSDADDVTSEAFARVLHASQSGGGPDVSFRPYLVATVRNVFYDRLRRNRELPSRNLADAIDFGRPDSTTDWIEGVFASDALASLAERWREVLLLTEVEGLSAAEVAPLLGLSPNAVAALAYRAREGLRQAYNSLCA
ncbi:MAG: sigma-70 family RNA polymerase sigma factor [Actinobacteria bacterium]|nr:sigma-70 family RNA polymerase sigma factor [Actinomycetota bacterium]